MAKHLCTSTSPVDMVQAKNSYSIHIALQKGPNHAHSPAEGPQTWDIAPTSNALWTQAASMVIQAMLNLL